MELGEQVQQSVNGESADNIQRNIEQLSSENTGLETTPAPSQLNGIQPEAEIPMDVDQPGKLGEDFRLHFAFFCAVWHLVIDCHLSVL